MDLQTVAEALANDTRIKILQIILTDSKTATETYGQYRELYEDSKHRETIYRNLESLVQSGLVEKEYRENRGLVYVVPQSKLILNLENMAVKPMNDETDRP